MTPDEHAAEAERLLDAAGQSGSRDENTLIARAHVHALLALRPTPGLAPGAETPDATAATSSTD
jgi:hypothetical protein